MDPNIPPSFTSLLEGNDSPRIPGIPTTPVTPINPQMSYPSYQLPDYYHHTYQSYPHVSYPRNVTPPYHSAPYNDARNVYSEYPHNPPHYPPPPRNPNYFSAGSNSTPSSTPTGSMVGVGNSVTDIDPSTEGDAEEVAGGVSVCARKWTVEEDQRLIRAWINIGTDAVVGTDQKKSSFWARVASNFNEHRPQGASTRSWKTLNGRWLRCSPLVSKWAGIMLEVERTNQSGSNELMIVEGAHRLYKDRIGKKFDLEHWYEMLKDQPKWRATCEPPKSGSSSSKRSNPDTDEVGDEGTGGSERPEGRKAAKRRLKEKANSTVVDLVTNQMHALTSTNSNIEKMFEDMVKATKEDRARKMMLKERKVRLEEDKILQMDTSMMAPELAAYYEQRKLEIMSARSGQSSSIP